ncbi:ARM repeat-containing protein [Guyanagaster necrorhizus]|uniref:ARM repeat-containing protein n=1 Tax=Guyanagaster necrorhizus TaxID=856835 RepID=A0A9P7W111_9AGAR|nr:ARM repeat-containing protein [Guyanagaster necrorhizus MCA 3950]KAG7450617.1 ARM repeat-containing protein [Guyanagaster necrorhizus MCA 3950]
MDNIQPLLSVLDVFTRAPDKISLENANTWLQDFQHSSEAWATSNVLLLSPDAPSAAKLFAAQTFRSKVTYDLHQVDPANLSSLRDTLLTALGSYQTGPRTIIVQLCLALVGLAVQYPAWDNAVQTMIDMFGRDPSSVPVLLQFLTLLPEELSSSTRYPVSNEDLRQRSNALLTSHSKQVIELLAMYLQAPVVTTTVQEQVFNCLRSWLVAGEISPSVLGKTALFSFAFDALASDQLFDSAVNVICDLIHETQEVDSNMPVIQLIVPRVIALKPQLTKEREDPEKIRGYARIFSEAGDTYRLLLIQHTEAFFPIVEAIGECSAYHDLDIVPITFPFWMRLANNLSKKPSIPPLFLNAYQALVGVIIDHLHFPPDSTPLSGQEADDFRSFRHVMGDTLKDCCIVLRPDTCLLAAYDRIAVALNRRNNVSWQEIEAPLFALRSMGAEAVPTDDVAVPKIMDLIPTLPGHPKVRYAALLIISRYTEWIDMHPNYISFQLQYISAGFDIPDPEVSAAAGVALKYMCQDCRQHLTEFLPTLHTFLKSSGAKLSQDDKRQVYEAIAYVISAMPMERAAESLRTFSVDILSGVHDVTNQATVMKDEMQNACDGLENLEAMLCVIQSFGEDLPIACQNTCEQTWAVFDNFLTKYGTEYEVAERTNRVLRRGITFYGQAARPVAVSVLTKMSYMFDTSQVSSYLWIGGKIVEGFIAEGENAIQTACQDIYERSTQRMIALLQTKQATEIPDVLEDYVHLMRHILQHAPDIFFQSPAFPMVLEASMAALTVVYDSIVDVALDLFHDILTHECLSPSPSTPSPHRAAHATAIQSVLQKEGYQLVGHLLDGLVGDFYEEMTNSVVLIFRSTAYLLPSELLSWLTPILQQIPTTKVPAEIKNEFLSEVSRAINEGQFDKIKYAMLALRRGSRKARERRRDGAASFR